MEVDMLRVEKILVPVDLSTASMAVAQFAATLACNFHASLTLMHISEAQGELRQRLEDLGRREFGSLPFSAVVVHGDPARVIVDYADSAGFDLIVMSTHGYGPFRRLLLGSVTTKVLDNASCPVFTGAHFEGAVAAHRGRFNTIVCAVDLGPRTDDIAAWAGDFAAAVGGRLFLIHIVPELGAAAGDYFQPGANLVPAHEASEELKSLCDRLGLAAQSIVAGGAVPEGVRHQAAELGADVLIAGRGTCTGRLGRLRSNAFEIVRRAPCPVITV